MCGVCVRACVLARMCVRVRACRYVRYMERVLADGGYACPRLGLRRLGLRTCPRMGADGGCRPWFVRARALADTQIHT